VKKVPFEELMGSNLLESLPFTAAIVDREYNVIAANSRFKNYFGSWEGKKCYAAYKGIDKPCANCMTMQTFEDGKRRLVDGVGRDVNGRAAHYLTHISPITNGNGEIIYVLEMSQDITESTEWQREYNIYFERVPCYITVIDKDYRIIRANEYFRETFGDKIGEHCYKVYKHRNTKCNNCPAAKTFKDGNNYSAEQIGITKTGKRANYVVNTTPLTRGEDEIVHVIEISTDITQTKMLEEELQRIHAFQKALIKNSNDGILASDPGGNITIFNPAARALLGYADKTKLSGVDINRIMPGEYIEMIDNKDNKCILDVSAVIDKSGEEIPVRLSGATLKDGRKTLGFAAFLQDLREIKKLEKEKLDAERLSAVGQTVAGLAHTIKNILMGLEGGMYMVHSGLKREDKERTTEGWEILEKNFNKITALIKDFLSFAKGRLPNVRTMNPNDLIKEIIDLYHDSALQAGIKLIPRLDSDIKPAALDPDGIHTCLANLVSNALDACLMSEKKNPQIVLSTRDENATLIFEVSDNGMGIDYKIKQKIFTTFFTTKGGGGTGLGLLTTRKIVQEHGGSISLESEEGKGSTFRMEFPRKRLPRLPRPNDVDKKQEKRR
jgi:PAS domain S-box-containing protein